jgi:hypothetical protein
VLLNLPTITSDWFTFGGLANGSETPGILHKPQQLASAVNFLLILAIVKYILAL